MMTKDRDYEDILRRALAAAAESIEPTGDGLQRIRHRLDSRRSARSLLSRCAEWLELHGTRLLVRFEPAIEWGRARLRRARPVLASFLAGLFSPRGRAGGRRGSGTPSPPGRLGPAGAWLKPVAAVAASVAIVVAGVVVLNHETQTVINPLNSSNPSGSGTSVGSGGKTANSKRWKLPLGVVLPTQQAGGQARNPKMKAALPAVACTPTPAPAPSSTTTAPTGSATATPTPTATGSATSTPTTPQPTDTATATPTPTVSAATGGTATATAAAALVVPDDAGAPAVVECGATPKVSYTP
jgi:hypothetical protein